MWGSEPGCTFPGLPASEPPRYGDLLHRRIFYTGLHPGPWVNRGEEPRSPLHPEPLTITRGPAFSLRPWPTVVNDLSACESPPTVLNPAAVMKTKAGREQPQGEQGVQKLQRRAAAPRHLGLAGRREFRAAGPRPGLGMNFIVGCRIPHHSAKTLTGFEGSPTPPFDDPSYVSGGSKPNPLDASPRQTEGA